MKPFSHLLVWPVVLLALVYLLAACGVGGPGATAPTPSALASDTAMTAPTQPSLPSEPILSTAAATVPPTAATTPQATSLPTAAAATEALPPSATTQASPAKILISYHKSGGIAGIDETVTVYADGTVEVRNKGRVARSQADPSAIQALQKLLANPELAALQVPMQPPVPDQFVYELTVPGRAKPIIATDAADNPQVLLDLITSLDQLKKQAK